MRPCFQRVQLSHFWQFELLLKIDYIWILFSWFVEPLGCEFTAMSYSCYHAFQLCYNRITRCFYLPLKELPRLMSFSRLPLKMYLKVREPLTCSGLTRGSSVHSPRIELATQ